MPELKQIGKNGAVMRDEAERGKEKEERAQGEEGRTAPRPRPSVAPPPKKKTRTHPSAQKSSPSHFPEISVYHPFVNDWQTSHCSSKIHGTFIRTQFHNSNNSFFRDRVNFVMLNVDNTKWEQELDEFGVEGIPHFVFLDKEGNEEGNVVGRLPRQYFLENVDALARGEASIPHSRVVGQFSSAEARKVHQVLDPRSHG